MQYRLYIIGFVFMICSLGKVSGQECQVIFNNVDVTNGSITFIDLCVDDDGNIYATGTFEGTVQIGNLPVMTSCFTYEDTRDVFVAKFTASGTPLWCRYAFGTHEEQVEKIIVDDNGNCYIMGNIFRAWLSDEDQFVHFHPSFTYYPEYSIQAGPTGSYYSLVDAVFVAKFNTNGAIQWAKSLPPPSWDVPHSSFWGSIHLNNNRLFCISYWGGVKYPDYPTENRYVKNELNITDGSIISEKQYTNIPAHSYREIDDENNIYIMAAHESSQNNIDINGYTISGNCYYLIKYNNNGGLVWYNRILVDEFWEGAVGLQFFMDFDGSNIYIYGNYRINADFCYMNNSSNYSIATSGSEDQLAASYTINGILNTNDVKNIPIIVDFHISNQYGLELIGNSNNLSLFSYNSQEYIINNTTVSNSYPDVNILPYRLTLQGYYPVNINKVYFCIANGIGLITLNNEEISDVAYDDFVGLHALYYSTIGDGWLNKSYWLNTSVSVNQWYGITTSGSQVSKIELGNNNLQGDLPGELNALTSLTDFDIHGNNVNGPMPENFWELPVLTKIDLAGNNLTGDIPVELNNRYNLEELYLDDNEFTRLPDLTQHLNLEYGDVSITNNYFTFIDIEPNMPLFHDGAQYNYTTYGPQKIIPINVSESIIACDVYPFTGLVNVGGNKFRWKQGGTADEPPYLTAILDYSELNLNDKGEFYCFATDEPTVPDLTLTCGPLVLDVEYIPGDVTCDKKVLAFDASLVLHNFVGKETDTWGVPSPWAYWRIDAGNVDGSNIPPFPDYTDGQYKPDPNDASKILQAAIGATTLPDYSKNMLEKTYVTVQKHGDTLSFVSQGGLYAFAFSSDILSTNNNKGAIFVHPDMIMAENVVGNNYKIGLASAQPIPANEPFLKVKMNNVAENTVIDVTANYTQQQINLSRLSDIQLAQCNKGNISLAPNPFTNEQYLHLYLPQAAHCNITIYDTFGHMVKQLFNGEMPAGHHSLQWDGTYNSGIGVTPGMYIYSIQSNDKKFSMKTFMLF